MGKEVLSKECPSAALRWYLICELEDDDFPAHPAELVTIRSLKKAFSKDRSFRETSSNQAYWANHSIFETWCTAHAFCFVKERDNPPLQCRMTKQNAEYLIENASRFAKKQVLGFKCCFVQRQRCKKLVRMNMILFVLAMIVFVCRRKRYWNFQSLMVCEWSDRPGIGNLQVEIQNTRERTNVNLSHAAVQDECEQIVGVVGAGRTPELTVWNICNDMEC